MCNVYRIPWYMRKVWWSSQRAHTTMAGFVIYCPRIIKSLSMLIENFRLIFCLLLSKVKFDGIFRHFCGFVRKPELYILLNQLKPCCYDQTLFLHHSSFFESINNILYACHYNPILIRNRNRICTNRT